MKNQKSIACSANTTLSPGTRIFRKGAGFSGLNREYRLHKQSMRPRARNASIIAGKHQQELKSNYLIDELHPDFQYLRN